MTRLTRGTVLTSAGAALGTISYLAYGDTSVFGIALVIWVLAFALAGGRTERLVLGPVLVAAYVTPAVFMLVTGRNASTFATIWMGALLAIILRTSWRRPWAIPDGWRWPLVTAALLIAVSWPVVAWRELDYSLANILNPRLPVASVKISGIAAAGGIAFTAAIQLVGLLWFDWLWGRFPGDRFSFLRRAVAPLGLALVLSCLVGVYQGLVDISFLSGHVWPSVRRATGTLMDANVFGTIAALWGIAFIVVAVQSGQRWGLLTGAGLLLISWMGVWTSGSRTAAMAALLALVIGGASVLRVSASRHAARIAALGFCAAIVVFAMLTAVLPTKSHTAFTRVRHLIPSPSVASVEGTINELWSRDGYGTAAVAVIREFPLAGLGVGCFGMLVHDFALERGIDIPPDNAQNWIRHQLAELGLLGSIGWMMWLVLFCVALWPRSAPDQGPGVALRGPLVAFGLVSLLGVPGQDPAVVMTFWLFVFWYAIDAAFAPGGKAATSRPAWAAMLVLVGAYTVAVAVPGELRPPFRAARFGFPYTYGMDFEGPAKAWTGKHGVTVQQSSDEWMKLTVWVDHPDARKKPVRVDIWKDQDHVLNQDLFLGERVIRYVRVGRGKRFVLEAEVDRTFRPSDAGMSPDPRELGAAVAWEFVPEPPGRMSGIIDAASPRRFMPGKADMMRREPPPYATNTD